MTRSTSILLLVSCILAGCTAGGEAPESPELLTVADLISMAQAGQPYLADPAGNTVVPMTAVVTPPGLDFYYRSPPFEDVSQPTSNTSTSPVLNLLPGISEGHFTPYMTMELWTNDFGPVWIQPRYQFVQVDANGNPVADSSAPPPPPFVVSVAPPHRFYSPFWRTRNVLVPSSAWSQLVQHPPTSERDVLDLPYPIVDGPLSLAPIVPSNLVLDGPLQPSQHAGPPTMNGAPPSWTEPPNGFPAWMQAILNAEYTPKGLKQFVQPYMQSGVYEGKPVSMLYFGDNWFTELPGAVVQSTPIFVWADLDAQGHPVPLGLPSIGGVDPLFSGAPARDPDWQPDWDAFWEMVFIVRPQGAQPFYPVVMDAQGNDLFAGTRAKFGAATPSADVDGLQNVARYAGRMAMNPRCFQATGIPIPMPSEPGGDPLAAQTAAWAATCGFLDSQNALETNLPQDSFIEPEIYILCPLVVWPWAPDQVNP